MSDAVKIAIAVAVVAAVVVGILALTVAADIASALAEAYEGAQIGIWWHPVDMLRVSIPEGASAVKTLVGVVVSGFFIVGGAKVVLRVLSV